MTRVLAQEPGGSVKVSEAAITSIIRGAVESVEGARLRKGRRRIALELADGKARAELDLGVAYGLVLPEVAGAVQERVEQALAQTFDVATAVVDITVVELHR